MRLYVRYSLLAVENNRLVNGLRVRQYLRRAFDLRRFKFRSRALDHAGLGEGLLNGTESVIARPTTSAK